MKDFFRKYRRFPFQDWFKQDVLILTNRGGRDTLGLLSVYAYLKYGKGLRVKIKSNKYLRHFWIKLFRPQVTIGVAIDCPSTVRDYEMLKALGSVRLMSQSEVFATQDPRDLVSKYEFKHLIDGVLLPGERMREILLNNDKILPSQAYMTGYPTFDWTSLEFRKYFLNREKFCKENNIPVEDRIILFVSGFSAADMDMSKWETLYSHSPESLTKERSRIFSEDARNMRLKSISHMKTVLQRHPTWHLIVRKHPFEDDRIYHDAFGNNPQVVFPHARTDIYDLLSVSDAIFHWNSTVSVQAWGLQKPTVLFDSDKPFFFETEGAASQKGNYVCHNEEQLENALNETFSGKPIPEMQLQARKAFIDKWFMGMDGKSASRIADTVVGFLPGEKEIRYCMSIADSLRGLSGWFKYKLSFCMVRALTLLRLEAFLRATHRLRKKYDDFTLEFYMIRFERKLKENITKQY